VRTRLLAAGAALALGALVLPAGAAGPAAQVTDQAGDANAVNSQGVSLLAGTADGMATPQQYAPADLLSITYSTTFDTVPVGDDGLRYVATGLQARIVTTEAAKSDGPTLIYRLNVDIGSCGGFLDNYVSGPASAPIDLKGLVFRQFASRGCAANATVVPPGWSSAVDGKALVFTMPFAQLSSADKPNFAVGKLVTTTAAEVRTLLVAATAPAIDRTGEGAPFRIGSDLPQDVPCTTGCPETP
jgi:hypothetical protein